MGSLKQRNHLSPGTCTSYHGRDADDANDVETDDNVKVDGDCYGYDSDSDGDRGEVESGEGGGTKESLPSERRRRLEEAAAMGRHFESRMFKHCAQCKKTRELANRKN